MLVFYYGLVATGLNVLALSAWELLRDRYHISTPVLHVTRDTDTPVVQEAHGIADSKANTEGTTEVVAEDGETAKGDADKSTSSTTNTNESSDEVEFTGVTQPAADNQNAR